MKLIIAIIKPFKPEEVQLPLTATGVERITVAEAKGFGRQSGHSAGYRGNECKVDFLPKVRIETQYPILPWPRLSRPLAARRKPARLVTAKFS